MLKSPVLRWIVLVVGGIVGVLALAVVVMYIRFDPQSIGPKIADQIEQATGRKATIGKISLKLFPAPSVSVAPVALASAGGAGTDALQIEDVAIRVHPWPLLRGRLEFGAIVIDRPTLTLARDAKGRWSFADILEHIAAKPKEAAPPAGTPAGGKGAFTIGVERATLRGGRIQIVDDAVVPGRRSEVAIGPIDATVSGWGMGGATSFDLSVGLGKSVLRAAAALEGEGGAPSLAVNVPSSRLDIADLLTLFPWLGVARPAGLAVSGAVSVAGKATMPLDKVEAIRFQGSATLDGVSYRDATMKRPIEKIGGTLTITGDRAQWENFKAVVGVSDLRGRLEVQDFMKPRIGFKLESSRLDLNQILETFAGGASAAGTAAPSAGAPGEGLLNVSAKGSLAVHAMRFQTFDVADARGTLSLEHAVMSLGDLQANLYGGALRGAARTDLSRQVPRHTIEIGLQEVDVNGAATAFDPTLKDLLRGTLAGDLGVEAEGLDMKPILDTVRGRAKIEIAKGALTSISMLKKLATLLEAAGGKGIGKEETPFESLRGTFAIGDKKATTNDLTLNSTDLDMAAQGSVGLDASLDLKAVPSFSVGATQGMVDKTPRLSALVDSHGRLTAHLTVKGSLASPSVGIDLSAQTQEARQKAKEKIQEKVKDKLQDRLKGLFGR